MLKVNIDYSNTIIYKITCKNITVTDIYVGHTTNFVQRKQSHKQNCKNNQCKLYTTIRDNGGWDNWIMEIIHFFKCENHYEARQTEQEYFKLLNATLNSVEPVPEPKIKNVKVKNKQPVYCKNTLNIKNKPKQSKTFRCELCDYITSNIKDLNKHLLTKKHISNQTSTIVNIKIPIECQICNKKYKDRTGLWRHNKTGKCTKQICTSECAIPEIPHDKDNIIMLLIKQNDDLIKGQTNLIKEHSDLIKEQSNLIKEQSDIKQIILDLVKNGTNNKY
jgi:hypothetical protein